MQVVVVVELEKIQLAHQVQVVQVVAVLVAQPLPARAALAV
jgi:hypothetical protein